MISPYVKVQEHGEDVIKTMGVDIDGLLCDFVCVPFENVFALPDGVSDEEALFAEYIAMGDNVFEALDLEKGDYIVVLGASTLGLIIAQMANYYQYVPILIDLDSDKLALAQKWGVAYTLNPTYDTVERRVEEITGGRMSEAAVFAGESVDINSAIRLVKNEGDVIIAGYATRAKHAIDAYPILKKQLKIKGVSSGEGCMSSAINLRGGKLRGSSERRGKLREISLSIHHNRRQYGLTHTLCVTILFCGNAAYLLRPSAQNKREERLSTLSANRARED